MARDEADDAWEQEERFREEAIRRVREAKRPLSGRCHNCGAECLGFYCDADCRLDDERRDLTRKRQGG